MAPNESTILTNYLLLPASLPTIVSLQEFIGLFPKAQQSSPLVRSLYRDLQLQRGAVVDAVADNIDAQVKQGKSLRRAVIHARRETEQEEQDDEIEIERALYGATSSTAQPRSHHLMTILPEMESASNDMEEEIRKLEQEEARLTEAVQQTLGNMSDLRYGRLQNSKLRTDILDGLENFQDTCARKT